LNVSLPVPPGTPEGDTGIIAKTVSVFGGYPALSVVDWRSSRTAACTRRRCHVRASSRMFTRYSAYVAAGPTTPGRVAEPRRAAHRKHRHAAA
jgi:hypothetical protein